MRVGSYYEHYTTIYYTLTVLYVDCSITVYRSQYIHSILDSAGAVIFILYFSRPRIPAPDFVHDTICGLQISLSTVTDMLKDKVIPNTETSVSTFEIPRIIQFQSPRATIHASCEALKCFPIPQKSEHAGMQHGYMRSFIRRVCVVAAPSWHSAPRSFTVVQAQKMYILPKSLMRPPMLQPP